MIETMIRFFFGTFRRQLISGMIVFYGIVIVTLLADLSMRQQIFLVKQRVGQAESLSQSVAVSAEGWLISRDFEGLQEIVNAQKAYPELVFAMILDSRDMVVAHTDTTRLGQYVSDMPKGNGTTLISNTNSLIDVATPVIVNGNKIGWVRIGIDRRLTTARINKIISDTVWYGLFAIFIASVLAYFMGNYITRRIHSIQLAVNAIWAGDMTKRANNNGADEVAVLAGQFNSMLDRIAADEQKLKESESRYHTIFNDSPVAIMEGDLSAFKARLDHLHQSGVSDIGAYLDANPDEVLNLAALVRIDDINQAAVRLMGATSKDQISLNLYNYFTDGTHDVFKQQIIALDGGAMRFESEAMMRNITGDTMLIESTLIIQSEQAQTWSKILVSFTDVTERKLIEEQTKRFNEELEEKVQERTAQLEAANKEMESFTYSVSHDLRAPLRAIDGFSAAVMEDYGDKVGAEGKDYLQRVRNAAQKMSVLIDDLLSLPRLTMGEINRTNVNLSNIANGIMENLRYLDNDRDVDIMIAEDMRDEADPHLIDIVLTNLLNNAWKFTSRENKGKIEFNCTQKGENKVYYIKDNGVGFDMSYINKLFLPFQRLHTAEDFPGSGIGLAAVYRAIKKHGGRVWAEGEVGQGATFFFTLKGG